ncbi:MAG: hypothetical protein DRJ45_06850 [Thermoprotei archaeon]|nr:MAG: hypothetical protein DRJ45_06850 [Thermoprotei archaeon]
MKKTHKTMMEFITEQNRLERTNGLPEDHPDGRVMPWDVPMSSEEIAFWKKEEEEYIKMIQESFK